MNIPNTPKPKNNIQLILQTTNFFSLAYKLKNTILTNIYIEDKSKALKNNNIYLAKVEEKVSGIGCYFLKLDNYHKAILKISKTNATLTLGQKILVQVVKEPTIPNKLATVSTDIVINGFLAKYKPLSKLTIFSKNITTEDRKKITEKLEDRIAGIIIKSTYKHSMFNEFITEIQSLKDKYLTLKNSKEVGLIYEESFINRIILNNSKLVINEIISEEHSTIKTINTFMREYPALEIKNTLYLGKENILDKYDLKFKIEEALSNNYMVNEDIHLSFIENEAFNYIDVNFSGNSSLNLTKEEALFKANLEIIPHIAHQIIIRDIAGQILVDILKVKSKQSKNNILKALQNALTIDENKIAVLGFSNLGLIEISRQKKSDSLQTTLHNNLYYELFLLMVAIQNRVKTGGLNKLQINGKANHLKILQNIAKENLQNIAKSNFININYVNNEKEKFPKISF